MYYPCTFIIQQYIVSSSPPSLMFQEHTFHLETSGISPEQLEWHPPGGRIINFALDSTTSQTGSMLNRKKGKKKKKLSHAFQSSSTIFRVQPAAHIDLPTPRTPSNTFGLDFEDDFEMSNGDAGWGLEQEVFETSGPSQCVYITNSSNW